MRKVLVTLLTAIFCLAGCSEAGNRELKVGRLHRDYVDASRTDWANAGPRPLAATIWYPAAESSVETDWGIGVFRFGRNAVNAPFAQSEKLPLIILSHGTGGSAAQLSWLAERLVEAGFLVAALNHHGNTAAEEVSWPHGFVLPAERARDLAVLIDLLLNDAQLAPRIDVDRIGAAGFSIGGYSVLAAAGAHLTFADRSMRCEIASGNPICDLPPEAGFSDADIESLMNSDAAFQSAVVRDEEPVHDARIRAVYAIAPAFVSLMKNEEFSAIKIPVRIVLAEDDQQVLHSETLDSITAGIPGVAVNSVPDVGHYAFLAPCNLRGKIFLRSLCKESLYVSRAELHNIIGLDAADFFASQL